jgi:hypothetical protein
VTQTTPTVPANQGITLTGTFTDATSVPTDPTSGVLIVTDPLGASASYDFAALEHPSTGVYRRNLTPQQAGRWTYTFQATGGILAAIPGVFYVAPDDWEPTIDDVGRKMTSRTADVAGNEVGMFNANTRPTANQVAVIIREETNALAGYVGPAIPLSLYGLAHVAALNRIAARIELDYFPEQIPTGRSPYEQYLVERDAQEGRLISAIRSHTGSGESGGTAIGSFVTTSQATLDSAALSSVVANGADIPPYTPTAWPLMDPFWGGTAGSPIV